jgi:hypothetical protein
MNLQKSLDRSIELFGLFLFEVRSHNNADLFDINRLCEDVLILCLGTSSKCLFSEISKNAETIPVLI